MAVVAMRTKMPPPVNDSSVKGIQSFEVTNFSGGAYSLFSDALASAFAVSASMIELSS